MISLKSTEHNLSFLSLFTRKSSIVIRKNYLPHEEWGKEFHTFNMNV